MSALVIGVDPGQTTGVVALHIDNSGAAYQPIAVQVHGYAGVVPIVRALVTRTPLTVPVHIAVEQFVIGNRAARSGTSTAGRTTRDIIERLASLAQDLLGDRRVEYKLRNAATVKPWATDERLAAAGLLESCKGMGHARDAARHALYAAVHAGVARDPLSKAVL